MTYTSVFRWSAWAGHDGENADAECQEDGPGGCGWGAYGLTLRGAKREAEDHVASTGHPVMVERTLWQMVSPVSPQLSTDGRIDS